MRVMALDIETVRDASLWTPPVPETWKFEGRAGAGDSGAFSGTVVPGERDVFAPPFAWHPIVIGFVLMELRHGLEPESEGAGQSARWRVLKVGAIEGPPEATVEERERAILDRFAEGMGKQGKQGAPTLITWNGRRFDLPCLMLRSMRQGIPCPWYYTSRDTRYRYSEDGHCDLADAMADYGATAHLGLDGMAKLIGLPGKSLGDVHGANVAEAFAAGRLAEITDYCVLDAVQTAFLWLRWRLLKGAVSVEEYRASARSLLEECARQERFSAFVGRVDRRVLLLEESAPVGGGSDSTGELAASMGVTT